MGVSVWMVWIDIDKKKQSGKGEKWVESAAPHPPSSQILSGLARTPISNTVTFPSACPLPRDQTRAASLIRHGALNFGTRATRT